MILALVWIWQVCGIHPLLYLAATAYPGFSLLMLRTYAEHRAGEAVPTRTAVIESSPLFGLLFLNNNLHAPHHERPALAWYRLPAYFRENRTRILTENGGYAYRRLLRGLRPVLPSSARTDSAPLPASGRNGRTGRGCGGIEGHSGTRGGSMIAGLPMYDEGRAAGANDALWRRWSQALEAHGIAAPEFLDRPHDLEALWLDPELLVAQICSLPCVLHMEAAVRIFAFPGYSSPGCGKGRYSSHIVVRENLPGEDLSEFAGAVFAVNDPHSQSGHMAMVMELDRCGLPMPFFGEARVSGAHRESIRMLAEGVADIAAIDCNSFRHFQVNGNPQVDQVRIIGRTPAAPAPPFVTSANREPEVDEILYKTLCETIADRAVRDACEALFLDSVEPPHALGDTGMEEVRAAWHRVGGEQIAREWVPPRPGN